MEILSIAIPKDMVGVQGVRPPPFHSGVFVSGHNFSKPQDNSVSIGKLSEQIRAR